MFNDASIHLSFHAVRVFHSAKGWFLGMKDVGTHRIIRESGYFPTREGADNALLSMA